MYSHYAWCYLPYWGNTTSSLKKGCLYSKRGSCLTTKDVVNDDNAVLAMKQFVTNFNQLEIAVEEKDYDKVVELVDVESFAKYYLLSEFTVNPDAYTSSWYMYKDGADDKIHAGPGWDYDYAFGNRNWFWASGEDFYSPELDMIREEDAVGDDLIVDGKIVEREPDKKISRVIFGLMKMSQFRKVVESLFIDTMSGRKAELLDYIKMRASKIYPIILKDNDRWGREIDYWLEVGNLVDWVNKRYEHFEKTYGRN